MSRPMFDEMNASPTEVRAHYENYARWLAQQPPEVMAAKREEAEMIFRRVGITFAVYGAKDETGAGSERLIPFDLIPRIIPAGEWARMQQGLVSFAEGAEWYDSARMEMLRFPAGVHDDQVDSLAWMAQLSVGRNPPREKSTRIASWKDRLASGFTSSNSGYLTA